MHFIDNIKFLSRLTYNNIKEYTNSRSITASDKLVLNSIYWFGHATTIMNLDNNIIITDPVLSNRLGYFKRIVNMPTNIKNKKLDYILLSHGHMDHLHFSSLRKLNKDAIVIVPKGYKRILQFLGFKNVILLRHGESYVDKNIKITAIEANHDGRRFYIGIDKESNSYMIESLSHKVFFAGDTALTDSFDGLTCDAAIMPVGCYMPKRFEHMHCSPIQSYNMFNNMNAKAMIPIHYKTFKISLENFDETEETLKNIGDPRIKLINIGQTYKL